MTRKGGNALVCTLIRVFQRICLRLELVLKSLVGCCAKNMAEDVGAVFRVGIQQLLEFALRDHCDLLVLAFRHAKRLPDFCIDGNGAGFDTAVGKVQFSRGLLGCHAASAFGGPFIARVPDDAVFFVAVGERQVDEGFSCRVGEVASKIRCASGFARGHAEQCEGNRIEDGGLSRPRVAADEVQAR